ncbi:MAG: hypothetical protein F6K48_08725, partial [Okeania sp. SIO3H1]|nr:hypothetical protein [Okeania sp. SIO3H1]
FRRSLHVHCGWTLEFLPDGSIVSSVKARIFHVTFRFYFATSLIFLPLIFAQYIALCAGNRQQATGNRQPTPNPSQEGNKKR